MATRDDYAQALVAAHRAGDTESAQMLAAEIARLDAEKQQPMTVGQGIKGIADMAVSAARGTAHQVVGTAMGLGGALHQAGNALGIPGARPDMGYMQGRNAYMQAAADDQLPIKGAQLRTPEGQRMAEGLMGSAYVGPAMRAIENVGQGIERIAGPEARDLAGTGMVLAGARIPEKMPIGTPGARALVDMRRNGFEPSPHTPIGGDRYAGTRTEREMSNLGGSTTVDDIIATRNQARTDEYVKAATGMPEVSPKAVDDARNVAFQAYDGLKQLNIPVNLASDPTFVNGVMNLGRQGGSLASRRPSTALAELQQDLLVPRASIPELVDTVRDLRQQAFKNGQSADVQAQRLGQAQREAADLVDDQIESYLSWVGQSSGNPNLQSLLTRIVKEYKDARAQLSVLHDVSDSMNPTTGAVDPKLLAAASQTHKLHPELQRIADAYNTAPEVMKPMSRTAKRASASMSAGDAVMAVPGAYAGALAGGAPAVVAGAGIGLLAPIAARYLMRSYAARGPKARAFQQATGASRRGITRAAVLGSQIEDQSGER